VPRVLRLNTLLDRRFQAGQQSLPALYCELRQLDMLCKSLGVTELSHFVDATEVELQEAAALVAAESSFNTVPETDPETGLAYGIDDMSWQPIAAGMSSLEALEQHLQREFGNQGSKAQLLTELGYCLHALSPLETEGAQFHLALEGTP